MYKNNFKNAAAFLQLAQVKANLDDLYNRLRGVEGGTKWVFKFTSLFNRYSLRLWSGGEAVCILSPFYPVRVSEKYKNNATDIQMRLRSDVNKGLENLPTVKKAVEEKIKELKSDETTRAYRGTLIRLVYRVLDIWEKVEKYEFSLK